MNPNIKVKRIARGFGIKVRKISNIQNGVYRITVPSGKAFALKRMPVTPKVLRWADGILCGMRRNGYTKTGWRNPNRKEGRQPFVQLHSKDSPHILVPWISGRSASPNSSKDMRACGVALAQFHKAGQRYRFSGYGRVNTVGKWPAAYRRQHLMMSRVINKVTSKRNGAEILSYSKQASQLLRNYGYQKKCRTHRHLIVLCHGDGGPTNFIKNVKGIHLIDFEAMRVDLRAYDLYRVIYNSCKDRAWKFSIAKSFLDGYQSVNKLERTDFMMLRALLRFPQTTYLLLSQYRQLGARVKSIVLRHIPRALAAERKMASFFRKFDRYAGL